MQNIVLVMVLMRAALGLKIGEVAKSGVTTGVLFMLPYLSEVPCLISLFFPLGLSLPIWP